MKSLPLLLIALVLMLGPSPSDASALSRLAKIHHILRQVKLLLNPNTTLADLDPRAKDLTFEHVKHCYDATLGGEHVDIFAIPVTKVLVKFVQFNYHLFADQDHTQMLQRLRNLIANIRMIARNVIQCSLNRDKDFKPTKIGLNEFSVLSFSEIQAKYTLPLDKIAPLGSDHPEAAYTGPCLASLSPAQVTQLPPSFDWRSKGYTSAVQNQGQCGSCYAWSAVAALEFAYQIEINATARPSFSVQDIINCYSNSGNDGCGMGYPHEVMEMASKRGLMLEKYSKYLGKVSTCKPKADPLFAKPKHYCFQASTPPLNDNYLKAIVFNHGPSVIGFNADDPLFWNLKGSAYNRKCPENKANHAMLLVGWDKEGNWLIKNSYGTEWGYDGYLVVPMSIARNCGIMTFAGVPSFLNKPKTALKKEVDCAVENSPVVTTAASTTDLDQNSSDGGWLSKIFKWFG